MVAEQVTITLQTRSETNTMSTLYTSRSGDAPDNQDDRAGRRSNDHIRRNKLQSSSIPVPRQPWRNLDAVVKRLVDKENSGRRLYTTNSSSQNRFQVLRTKMVVCRKSHHSDAENFQNAELIRVYVGMFRFGYWIFVRPGSEKTWIFETWFHKGSGSKWRRKRRPTLQLLTL